MQTAYYKPALAGALFATNIPDIDVALNILECRRLKNTIQSLSQP